MRKLILYLVLAAFTLGIGLPSFEEANAAAPRTKPFLGPAKAKAKKKKKHKKKRKKHHKRGGKRKL